MVANLAGFGSFWALGDHNQPNWARGTVSWCRLKLQHQPWTLWFSGRGTASGLPMFGRRWRVRSLVGYQVEVLRTQNKGGIL